MKKRTFNKSARSLALAASLLVPAAWTTTVHACAAEPYLAAVCVMAMPNYGAFGNTYFVANGTQLQVNQYNALYALIGQTYGGSGQTAFNLPNLSGRVILGAGISGQTQYIVGATGGGAVTLTAAQLPAHYHPLSANAKATAAIGSLAATTTLTGLSATTSLTGVTASASASGLSLNGSSGGTAAVNPGGSSLGTTSGTSRIYSNATPSTSNAMLAGSITGTLPVTFTGTPTTTVTGNPTTTLSGAPTVTMSGTTDLNAAQSAQVPTLPPYLVMTYYIAVTNGIFPVRD